MRVAATLERGAAQDRRRFLRHPVVVGAGLASANDRPGAPVIVVDLSTHGCGLEVAGHCEVGARVWLKLAGLESWPARIAWAEGERAGLSFDRPLHQAVVDRYV
jgi:PilZ domain